MVLGGFRSFHVLVWSDQTLNMFGFIAPNLSVPNLGVIMDNCFCMEQHVKKICSEANYHLRNISKIRKYLTQDSALILIHAFISAKSISKFGANDDKFFFEP